MKLRFLLLFCVLLAGCENRTVVDAIPRNSTHQTVFVSADNNGGNLTERAASKNNLDLSILHQDHFACVQIAAAKVASHSDLEDVDWKTVEAQLEPFVGARNSQLASISNAWILFDRENLSLETMATGSVPVMVVLDYDSAVDESAFVEAQKIREKSKAEREDFFFSKRIGESRIAIGPENLVQKIGEGIGADSALAIRFSQLNVEPEVNGALIMQPIRGFLKSIFGIAAGFSEEGKKLAEMPDFIQHVDLQISVSGEELLSANINVDDENLIKDIVRLVHDSMNGSASATQRPPGLNAQKESLMFVPSSVGIMQKMSEEIRDKDLLSVLAKEQGVVVKLKRPSSTKELIGAIIRDGKRQAEIAIRVERLNRIATALKQYEDKYGCLPSSDAVFEHESLPNQFSWRTALLPMLGEEELYKKFDFSKPWDDASNQKIAKQMPDVFSIAGTNDRESTLSAFRILSGKNAIYNSAENTPALDRISDRKSSTAVLAECSSSQAVDWTKPTALNIDSGDVAFGNDDENGVLIISAAFKTRIAKKDKLAAIISIDGNETVLRPDFISLTPN